MAGGNPVLADGLARWLVEAPRVPDGVVLPATLIVAGHSAGGAFAARLGAQLAAAVPPRLAGALLFDPVATRSFEADLLAISDSGRRPVLAVLAQAHGCNADLSAAPALRRVRAHAIDAGRDGFVGVQLSAAATHIDVEGEDSDWLARAACGEPEPSNTRLLRALAVRWAQQIGFGVQPTVPAADGGRSIE
jgi:pimeloyl-ACP methyl ester carboxylesterase